MLVEASGFDLARRALLGSGGAGALFGLTRDTRTAEFARAMLEAVGYQTRDLLEAMHADWPSVTASVLRVDGGMSASDITMQFLADILAAPVDRPMVMETTVLGAAYLAGYGTGVCADLQGLSSSWQLDQRCTPVMGDAFTRCEPYIRASGQLAVNRKLR